MKSFGQEKYTRDIKEMNNLSLHQFKGLNSMFDVFQDKIIEIIDSNAPYITLTKKQSNLRNKPWITSSILKSIKNKSLYYKKFMKTKNTFWSDRYMVRKMWTKINKILKNKTKINEVLMN